MTKYINAIELEIKELEIELLNNDKIELNDKVYRRLNSLKAIVEEIKNEIKKQAI